MSPSENDDVLPSLSLRALQPRDTIPDRDYFVDDNDIIQGLQEDNEVAPIREEMMQVRCTNCNLCFYSITCTESG